MTVADYLLSSRAALDALADLVSEAAENDRPVRDIAAEVLARVREVRSAIDILADDEGTE